MAAPSYEELLDRLRRDGAELIAVAEQRPDTPVPTCGDWTMSGLLGHIGLVHRTVATIVGTRAQVRPSGEPPPPGADVVEYAAEGLAAVTDALASVTTDEPVWNWLDDRPAPALFWARRMAFETVVHRADADLAAGRAPARDEVTPSLAAAGVEEFCVAMLRRHLAREPIPELHGTLHLHATDPELEHGEGEWLLELSATACDVRHGHGKGEAAVRAPAYDLLLGVYNRVPLTGLEAHGDPRLLHVWQEQVRV